jgi:hypothetical protein
MQEKKTPGIGSTGMTGNTKRTSQKRVHAATWVACQSFGSVMVVRNRSREEKHNER